MIKIAVGTFVTILTLVICSHVVGKEITEKELAYTFLVANTVGYIEGVIIGRMK